MARKAKAAPVETAPVETAPAEKVRTVSEELIEMETMLPPPKKRIIKLAGRVGGTLDGAINGTAFSLPTGIEMEVSEEMYHAVQAHIVEER